jgi:hypothetical protein
MGGGRALASYHDEGGRGKVSSGSDLSQRRRWLVSVGGREEKEKWAFNFI